MPGAARRSQKLGAAVAGALWLSAEVARALKVRRDEQLGLAMPKELDFSAVGPKPLIAVGAAPEAQVAKAGVVQFVMGTDVQTGGWSIRTASDASQSWSHWTPVAWALYNKTVSENGWAYLAVRTTADAHVSTDLKMYAAGYLEGFATAGQIRDFRHNAGVLLEKEEERHHALDNIQTLFGKSLSEICKQSGMKPGTVLHDSTTAAGDPWWRQARFALAQAWGTLDAYNQQAKMMDSHPMSMVDLMVLNSDGETPELEEAYDMEEYLLRQSQGDGGDEAFLQRQESHSTGHLRKGKKPRRSLAAKATARRQRAMQGLGEDSWRKIKESGGRCSALVRLTKDNGDLMVGHTTFSDYSEMNRIFKYYDFNLGDGVQKMGFSSYPGVAGSTDDYYLLDSGLVITETTVSMLTDEPYDKLQDNITQLPDFMRIMVANRLARNGTHWAQLMAKSSTGTYSSQWMVVDYNKFTPGKPVVNGTLTVLETVPGLSHMQDMSKRLQDTGFWASENRAWFPDVRESIGAKDAEEVHGPLFSAEKNPRAKIFAATAPQVQTLADMRRELRRNRWPNDLGGESNTPDHAIAARGDLDKDHPDANGGVDAKVTNACLAKRLQCDAISGPTADTQKPFRWTDPKTGKELFPDMPHQGLPDVWNFDWVRMAPAGEHALGAGEDGSCA